MNETESNQSDEKLSALLQSARPVAELPPRFAAHVWRRIEQTEQQKSLVVGGVMELLSRWFVTPRIAVPVFAALVMLAVVAGAVRGVHLGNREARARYVASVAPSYLQH